MMYLQLLLGVRFALDLTDLELRCDLIAFMSTPEELLLTRLRAFLGRLDTFGDVVPSVYMPPWALG